MLLFLFLRDMTRNFSEVRVRVRVTLIQYGRVNEKDSGPLTIVKREKYT